MQYYYYYKMPIGGIWIVEEDGFIVKIKYYEDVYGMEAMETPLIKRTHFQLTEYFDGKRKTFDIPLKLKGTSFQKRVWTALQKIPYGEVWNYQQVADFIKCPKGGRAVGTANNHNPIPIIIPCHRVSGFNGELVGYASGVHKKKILLRIEQNE